MTEKRVSRHIAFQLGGIITVVETQSSVVLSTRIVGHSRLLPCVTCHTFSGPASFNSGKSE